MRNRHVAACVGSIVMVVVIGDASAEMNIVTIPGEGWHLALETTAITSIEATSTAGRFSYSAADGNTGITFSIHTEPMINGTHKSCRDQYLAKTKLNPYVIQNSLNLFETSMLHGATYRSEGEFKGRAFSTANAHGYFVKNGKCVDLHVSQIPNSDEGRARVEKMIRSAKTIDQKESPVNAGRG